MKKLLSVFAILFFAACGQGAQKPAVNGNKYTIATVGKIDGISWFTRMKTGVEEFKAETGHDAFMISPAQADAAQQVQIIENLIAQGVNAICVVPFSPEAVEPVLKKAREKGIIVVVHESSQQQNADAIIEAFSNFDFGKEMGKYLVQNMGEKGEVATFVGSLTSKSHNEQQDGVEAFLKDYPNIKIVSRRNEDYDDQTKAYEKTKEVLTSYPNLTGIVGSASTTVPGAALAVEEKKLIGKVSVVGVATPVDSRQYLNSGAAKTISLWDPALAAKAMNTIAVRLLDKQAIKNGDSLGILGYESLKQDPKDPKLFFANAWLFLNKDEALKYDF